MKTGVSTSCLFPALTEQALDTLAQMGIKTTEVFLNSPSERTSEFALQLVKTATAAGMEIVSVHPYSSEAEGVSFFSRYPRRFDDEAEDYRRYFEFCNWVGAQMLVFHGARSFMTLEPGFYFERFSRLSDIARSFGVRLCQENVARCYSGKPEFIRNMAEAVPDVGFVLDIKQALRADVTPFEMLEAMQGHLAHLHLSDHDKSCDCLVPGQGVFDFAALAKKLKLIEYNGAVIIELYRWNYENEQQLAESLHILEEFL